MNWESIWNTIKDFFSKNIWNILIFIAVLVVGIIAVKLIMNILRRILNKTKMEKIAQNFLLAVIKLGLYLILILILFSIVGVQITGIITALSALLLTIGLALENNISNVANGIIIIATHMFKKGDYIIVNGVEGSIVEINFLFTTLITTDNKKITIPNSTIVNSEVINSGANATRRVDFTFSVAYESDVELVKKIVTDVMKSDGRIYLEPKPFCKLKTLNSSSIDFFSNCWCDTSDYWDVYYYVIENVYNEFKRNNISVPYNQLEIRERTDDVVMPVVGNSLPKRVEKVREEKKKSFDIETADFTHVFKKKAKNANNKPKEKNKTKLENNLEENTKNKTIKTNSKNVTKKHDTKEQKVESKLETKVESKTETKNGIKTETKKQSQKKIKNKKEN